MGVWLPVLHLALWVRAVVLLLDVAALFLQCGSHHMWLRSLSPSRARACARGSSVRVAETDGSGVLVYSKFSVGACSQWIPYFPWLPRRRSQSRVDEADEIYLQNY